MKKIIVAIVAIALIISGVIWFNLTRSQSQKVTEIPTVRIANLPFVHGLPLYLALEKGYFKDAGINVEVETFEAPNQAVDALIQGKVDFSSPTIALGITGISDYKNPGKLKIYAVSGDGESYGGHDLIVPTNSTLKVIKDLKGKKLGILAGTIQWRTITRELLAQNGLDMDKDVNIMELAPSVQAQALGTGQVDALLAIEPIPTIAIGQGVAKMWIQSPVREYVANPLWIGAGVVRADYAKQNPEITQKLIGVIERAIKEVQSNPDASRKYLEKNTSLTSELINKVPMVDFKLCSSLNDQDKKSINNFYSLFKKYKVVDGDINLSDLLFCK